MALASWDLQILRPQTKALIASGLRRLPETRSPIAVCFQFILTTTFYMDSCYEDWKKDNKNKKKKKFNEYWKNLPADKKKVRYTIF